MLNQAGAMSRTSIHHLEWVDWINDRRLLETIGTVPPVEAPPTIKASFAERNTGEYGPDVVTVHEADTD